MGRLACEAGCAACAADPAAPPAGQRAGLPAQAVRHAPAQLGKVCTMDEWTIKTPNLICLLFRKIDLWTDFAALCLTDFIDWRYIHSVVCIFDPACEPLPPWTKELFVCTVAPLPSLWRPPPPKLNVQYIQTMCVTVVNVGGGMLSCIVDHILQEFYTLFLTIFRTYKIASKPQTKMTCKDDIKRFVSLKFLRLWYVPVLCNPRACIHMHYATPEAEFMNVQFRWGSQTVGFRTMFTLQTRFNPLLLKGWSGLRSASRGDCE